MDRDASAADVKKAFRRLARELHPDVNPGDPEAVMEAFSGLFGPSYVLALFGGLVAGVLVTSVVYGYVRLYRAGEAGRVTTKALWAEATDNVTKS